MSNERLHELDAMRSVLMLLGIVLHAANPYRSSGNWLVADSARLGMFDAIEGRRSIGSEMDADTYAKAAARLARGWTPVMRLPEVVGVQSGLDLAGGAA